MLIAMVTAALGWLTQNVLGRNAIKETAESAVPREVRHKCAILDEFAKLHKATTSFVTSVCLSTWNNSTPN
jgi:hypothetical protein